VIHRRATGRFRDQICSTAIIYLHVQDRASNDRNMWRAVGKIMMWRCIHDGESRVVFSLKKVVCALVSANFAAARAVRVEFFHCKGGGRAAKRVIFNVISGLVFWPCCKFSAGVYPLSCSRPSRLDSVAFLTYLLTYLSTDQPPPKQPHEADHCSAGAGSAGQSKQRPK